MAQPYPFRLEQLQAGGDPAIYPVLAVLMMQARAVAMPWLPVLHDEADTAHFLAGLIRDQIFWLARAADGDVLGFIVFDGGWVNHLYLLPAAQRQGLGTALLAQALADGQPRQLWCFANNTPARRFYERHGFTLIESTDGAANEERCPDVRYQHVGRA